MRTWPIESIPRPPNSLGEYCRSKEARGQREGRRNRRERERTTNEDDGRESRGHLGVQSDLDSRLDLVLAVEEEDEE